MLLEDKLYPMMANDDAHGRPEDHHDTYEGWTMVRVKERNAQSIVEALAKGASYGSTGPEIRNIRLTLAAESTAERRIVQATVDCSPARWIYAVCDEYGSHYDETGDLFESATINLRANARWVRFEVVGPKGHKAWSNPFDLTGIQ